MQSIEISDKLHKQAEAEAKRQGIDASKLVTNLLHPLRTREAMKRVFK